jgi:hypothetical protein
MRTLTSSVVASVGTVAGPAVAERQQYLTRALRDFLNEGGKLVQAGESTQYFGLLGRSLGGIFYGLAGAPDQDCVITRDFLADCLLLSDDFAQYYLGANHRAPLTRPTGIDGRGARRRDGRARRAGRGRQPARPGRSVLPDERRAARRGLSAVRRRRHQRLSRGSQREPVRPGRRVPLRRRPQGTGVVPAHRPHRDTGVEADGFEADDGAWAVEGPPAGSPPGVHGNFAITEEQARPPCRPGPLRRRCRTGRVDLAHEAFCHGVAKAVLLLASDDSTRILGEEIIIDGGMATL